MSWLEKLYETYDRCSGQPQFEQSALTPVSAVPQTTDLHVTLWPDGSLLNIELSPLEATTMFVTEDSASRSGKAPAANPLTEQLEYCARGMDRFGGDPTKHDRFTAFLSKWVDSGLADAKVSAVLAYVRKGSLIDDLLDRKIVEIEESGLAKIRKERGAKVNPAKLWIRWSVHVPGTQVSDTWADPELAANWAKFDLLLSEEQSFCMMTGDTVRTTQKHPKRIRSGGDNAKLISSNDTEGFTYKGKFRSSSEAVTVGYVATQKAHNALRWLIARQGARYGDQVVVSWATGGQPVPRTVVSTWELFFGSNGDAQATTSIETLPLYEGDAGQAFAKRLNKLMSGYAQKLGERDDIVVMALDSATPGRMAIAYYRELRGSEFLARIQHWHDSLAWPQMMGKGRVFVGAPAPQDIAEAAYGRRIDDKLRKATVERLLPCIIDARPLPRDLVTATVQRTCNRAGMKQWLWEQTLGIACSLIRGSNPEEHYTMGLDKERTTRDYLYRRLLAIAEDIESLALFVARENRDTSAAKLMQRFADHPHTTWRTLELGLRPYVARLRSTRPGALTIRLGLFDEVIGSFRTGATGSNEFLDNSRLTGEFLLGYHSQRSALKSRNGSAATTPETEDVISEPLGDN